MLLHLENCYAYKDNNVFEDRIRGKGSQLSLFVCSQTFIHSVGSLCSGPATRQGQLRGLPAFGASKEAGAYQ